MAELPSASGSSAGMMGLDAGVPEYEQDDPNLHPPDDAYQRIPIPVAVDNVMSFDVDADENVYVLRRGCKLSQRRRHTRVVNLWTDAALLRIAARDPASSCPRTAGCRSLECLEHLAQIATGG